MKTKIYTLDYCPYCRMAINFFQENEIDFEQIKIDENEEEYLKQLKNDFQIKGEVTVPQIISNGKRIGGYSDLVQKLQKGEVYLKDL
ncbi:glutaredoxin [bacterium]|nr:glutaredoxin [bacterium]